MAPKKGVKNETLAKEAVMADAEDDMMEDFEGTGSEEDEVEEDGGVEFDGVEADLEGAAADLDLDDASDFEDDEDNEDGETAAQNGTDHPNGTGSTASVMSLDAETAANPSLNPTRPTPYIHDAGHLLVTDPNSLPSSSSEQRIPESVLASTARDAAQSLISHLLTTCPITTSKSATSGSGVLMNLPPPEFALPREKPVPVPKPPTKWEQFAAKKGIGKNKRKHQDGENRAGKLVYDEASGEWVPRYGYKGKNKAGEKEWLVEVDAKQERQKAEQGTAGKDPRTASRAERLDRMKRNERRMRANERKSGKGR